MFESLLGILLMALRGLNTRIVLMAEMLRFSVSTAYSMLLEAHTAERERQRNRQTVSPTQSPLSLYLSYLDSVRYMQC